MRDPADALREREFDECEQGAFGWDGYHTEDGVAFARMFRRQRDAAEARVAALTEALRDARYYVEHDMYGNALSCMDAALDGDGGEG